MEEKPQKAEQMLRLEERKKSKRADLWELQPGNQVWKLSISDKAHLL